MFIILEAEIKYSAVWLIWDVEKSISTLMIAREFCYGRL